jgi:hypothetical protein
MKIAHVGVLVLSIVAVSLAARLVDSGNPTSGMNSKRNWKSNRPLACADVSKGKTTILQEKWTWDGLQAGGFSFSSNRELSIDEKGFMYVIGPFPEQPLIAKLHTNGSFFPTPTYQPSYQDAVPTHVQGGEMYLGGSTDSDRVNSNTMTQIAYFIDVGLGEGPSSYVPYGSNLMVKSNIGAAFNSDAFTWFSITGNIETTGQQVQVGSPQYHAMIYNNSGIESVIVIGDTGEGWKVGSTAWTPYFIDRTVYAGFVKDNELVLACDSLGNDKGAIYRVNAANGQLVATHNFTLFEGNPSFYAVNIEKLMYQNGKSLVPITFGESPYIFADLINDVEYMTSVAGFVDQSHPIISSDNIVLLPIASIGGNFEFHGFDWDTRVRKLHGRIPMSYENDGAGSPVISENCNVHINVGNKVYTLSPMPLQNIVPIFECFDAEGYGYFTFNNLEQKSVWVPHTVDRNNFNNSAISPFEEFPVGRGPYYPLSQKMLVGTSGVVTWILEDYTLSVTLNPNLACPTTAIVTITLRSESQFPPGFNEVVRSTFVQVNNITDSRVTIVNKKRDVAQSSTLETELAIAPDETNSEPSPQQVVQNFVSEEVQQQFVTTISNTTDAPQDIALDIAGKAVSTEVQGVLPPPVAAPVAPEPQQSPQAQPTAVPIAGPESSAVVLNVSIILVAIVLFAISM